MVTQEWDPILGNIWGSQCRCIQVYLARHTKEP